MTFRATTARLLRFVGIQRAMVAMFLLGLSSIALNLAGPRLLGRATDLIFAGFLGRRIPAGTGKSEAVAHLRQTGQDSLARMVESAHFTPGQGFDMAGVARILSLALVIYAVSGLCWILQGRQATTAIQRSGHRLRAEVAAKLARLPLSYVDASKRGDILSRSTNDIDNIVQTLQQTLSQLTNSLLLIVGLLGVMFWISPLLALIALVVVPAAIALTTFLGKRAQPYFGKQWKATGELNAHVEEVYSGHALVQVFDQREQATASFRAHNDEVFQAGYRAQWFSGVIQPSMNFVNNIGYVLVAIVGCIRVASGTLSIGDLQAFIIYSRQLSGPLTQVTSLASVVQSGIASAQRVFELLDAGEESEDGGGEVAGRPRVARGLVRFESVSFRYEPDKPLIDDLSLAVEPGTKVAIVGPTGAGKTTLVNLLMRFYDVTGGRITMDGTDITHMPRRQLRGAIGMVLQDAWLFTGTIAENIGYGRENATRAEIEAAAAAAHADHFIHTLSDGYETVIDDERNPVSSGERQLITIARAFVADPTILILDEATSSVDARTELLIRRAMERLSHGRTSFVIAHRLSTIRDADVILVMRDGSIVERGTHRQLIAAGGVYEELYRSQFAGPEVAVDDERSIWTG